MVVTLKVSGFAAAGVGTEFAWENAAGPAMATPCIPGPSRVREDMALPTPRAGAIYSNNSFIAVLDGLH